MRRLNISNIQVDTTKKKDLVIKNTLQLGAEYRGNFLNNMICPITYNEVDENVIYYNGTRDVYTLVGAQVKKNGYNVFNAGTSHIELRDYDEVVNKDSDTGVKKEGSTISFNFGNTTVGTISVVDCGYDYFLSATSVGTTRYITLFPTKPTSYKNIKSWVINGSIVTEQNRYFVSPLHEVIDIYNNRCKVGDKYICEVVFVDMLMSGDTNHVMYTALNDNGYYYSNLEFYDKTFIISDSLLLATSSDGVYYGGFKVKKGDWSIDYYNNVPVQVSYKNKVMVNQIDYAYFHHDYGEVNVVVKGKTYYLADIYGTRVSIVEDRFIVANSSDVYLNTYDMETGKTFCRNDSYSGSLLFLLPEASLVDEEERGTFYVATGINTQGQVEGNYLQGTIWPSFPVYGLKDNNFQLLDYWNETSRVTVQVYKGTSASPTVPEFSFSLGGYLDYSGYVYPDSTNTLYSVTEVDTFSDTYSGVQLINTPVGNFLTALSNKQNFSFSYYLGTLAELDSVFVLRGSIYGITSSGYIVQMNITDNVISTTAIVTRSGMMQFLGNTQDYALFYNPYEKALYKFDAGLKLTYYKEFSIADITHYTCRAEDDKIVVATNDSLYLFSGESIFRIETEVNLLKFCKGWLLAGNRVYSSYGGDYRLDVEYDSGRQGSTYDTSVQLDEVDIMLDNTDITAPAYLEYRIDVDDAIGEVKEIDRPNCNNIIRLRPTGNRNEGLYYRLWVKTNCNIMGISVQDNAEKKPNLTRNNG